MLPHKHEAPKTNSHSHNGSDHHHQESGTDNSSGNTDHSAEFGNVLAKPVNGKYELTPLKFIPFLQPASLIEISNLYSLIPPLSSALPEYLIPPDPDLQGIGLRGPPSVV